MAIRPLSHFGGPQAPANPSQPFFGDSFGSSVLDVGKGVLGAVPSGIVSFYNLGEELSNLIFKTEMEIKTFEQMTEGTFIDPQTGLGDATRSLSTFLFGLIGAGKATGALKGLSALKQGSKLGRIGVGLAEGALVDFALVDPDTPRIANILEEFAPPRENSVLYAGILDYLKFDPTANEERLSGRLKNAIEGAGLGVGAELLVGLLRFHKAAAHLASDGDPANAARLVEEMTGLRPDVLKPDLGLVSPQALADLEPLPRGALVVGEAVDTAVAAGREAAEAADPIIRHVERTLVESDRAFTKSEAFEIAKALKTVVRQGWSPTSDEFQKAFRSGGVFTRFIDEADSQTIAEIVNFVADDAIDSMLKANKSMAREEIEGVALQAFEVMGGDPAKYMEHITKTFRDTRALPYKVVLYKTIVDQHSQSLVDAAKAILKDSGDDELFNFLRLYDRQIELQSKVRGIVGNTGRALWANRVVSLKKQAKDFLEREVLEVGDDQLRMLQEQARQLTEQAKGSISMDRVRDIARDLVKAEGDVYAAINGNLDKASEGFKKFLDVLHEVRLTNMFGPATNVVNIVGMAYRFIWEDIFENTVATGIQRIAGGPIPAGAERLTLNEVAARAMSFHGGLFEFFTNLGKGVRGRGAKGIMEIAEVADGLSIDHLTRLSLEGAQDSRFGPRISGRFILGAVDPNNAPVQWLSGLLDTYGKVARAPSLGVLQVSDAAFKNGVFRSASRGLATRKGLSAGLKGVELDNFVKRSVEFAEEYAKNPQKFSHNIDAIGRDNLRWIIELQNHALESARKAASQEPVTDSLGGVFRWIDKHLHNDTALSKVMKTFVMPFYRTPLNLLTFVGKRTPLIQQLSKELRAGLAMPASTVRGAQARAKVVMGYTLYGGAMSLAATGFITGSHDPQEREAKLTAGIPEYSLFVGGKYYQYNRQDPFGSFLGISADTYKALQRLDRAEATEAMASTIAAFSNNVLNKSYMQGLSDFFLFFQDQKAFQQRYLTDQVLRTSMPRILGASYQRFIADALLPVITDDTGLRETSDVEIGDAAVAWRQGDSVLEELGNYWKRLNQDSLLYRPFLPVRTDALGNRLERNHADLPRILTELTGFRQLTPTESPAILEIARHRLSVRNDPLTHQGVKMNEEEFVHFKDIMARLGATAQLDRLVLSPEYQRASFTTRREILQAALTDIRGTAKGILYRENAGFRVAVADHELEERLNALLPEGAVFDAPTRENLREIIRTAPARPQR